jgi:hypothetical protein
LFHYIKCRFSPREKEIKVSALPENSSGEKLPDVNMSSASKDGNPSVKSQVYHPHLPPVRQVNLDFRFSTLSDDPNREHIIGLVLEQFPYL